MVTTPTKLIPSDIEALRVNFQIALMQSASDEHLAHLIAIQFIRGNEFRFYSPKVSAALNCIYHFSDYSIKLTQQEMIEYADIVQNDNHHRTGYDFVNLQELVEEINKHIPEGKLSKYFSYWIGRQENRLFMAVEVDASYRVMDGFNCTRFNDMLLDLSVRVNCMDYWQERESLTCVSIVLFGKIKC